ncbi:MAG: YihY/virulence factor BrkB family protein [Thioalkalivibrio sp.]|nr:YihY/virulence factor BrkB family protein [Thioalkalivibrio sp.]
MAHIVETTRTVLKKAIADDITGTSARVAYYFFLAIFPAIIALFALTGLVGGDEAFEWIMSLVRRGIPSDAEVMLEQFVGEITGESRPGLLSLGILGVLWAASNSFNGLTIGLNKMYNVDEHRSWWKRRLGALGLLIAAGIALNLGATAILAGPELVRALGLDLGVVYLTWGCVFVVVTGLFWLTYYLLPNADQSSGKMEVLIGAVVGTVVWVLASTLFRAYVANFGSYDATYGVVGGVIVLMLWLYITALAILFGGEVAATLQQRAPGRTSLEP